MLRSLPKVAAPRDVLDAREGNGRTDLTRGYARLREEFAREGRFDPNRSEIVYRVGEVVLMHVVGAYLVLATGYAAAGIILLGLASGRCGWLMHEAGHYSLTGEISVDRALQELIYGVGCGMSGAWWRNQHNKHHATPQKIRHDMDLDTTPAVAFFDTAVEDNRPRGFSRRWARLQAWTFVPVTSGLLVQAFWIYVLHPRQVLRKRNWEEAGWMLTSHVVRTAVIRLATGYSWPVAYWWFTLGNWFAYMYLFAHFSTSHTHLDVVPSDKHISWVHYAVDHTVDIDPSKPVVNWLMGYLNCQVIHHLFPDMPQFRQPEVSRRFAAFAKKWNLNYKVLSYAGAWRATFGNLNKVGQHYYVNGTKQTRGDEKSKTR